MDKVFKALADPSRRKLLDGLRAENGQTLGRLCAHLDMTRQAVTKHLAVLEQANLVVVVWRGREKLHYLNPVPIHDIAERWIGKFDRGRLRILAVQYRNHVGKQLVVVSPDVLCLVIRPLIAHLILQDDLFDARAMSEQRNRRDQRGRRGD